MSGHKPFACETWMVYRWSTGGMPMTKDDIKKEIATAYRFNMPETARAWEARLKELVE